MEVGDIVIIYDGNKIYNAVCKKIKSEKITVFTENGKEKSLNVNRIVYKYPLKLDINKSNVELMQKLNELWAEYDNIKKNISIQEIWELVKDEQVDGGFDINFFTELVLDKNSDIKEIAALIKYLFENKIYFKIVNNKLIPKTEQEIHEYFYAIKRKKEKAKEIDYIVDWIKKYMEGEPVQVNPQINKYLNAFKKVAIYGTKIKEYKTVHTITSKLRVSSTKFPFQLLTKLGIFSEDENLALYQYEIPIEFDEAVLEEANKLAQSINLDDEEITFSGRIITIDSEETEDYDDAISISFDNDLITVAIHISDVSSYILKGSLLDEEAKYRSTSIYMPDLKIPMLPPILSENYFSLRKGKKRRVISAIATFDKNLNVVETKIEKNVIIVSEQLTYEQATEMLNQNDKALCTLYEISKKLRNIRIQNGAIIQIKPEIHIKVDKDNKITVKLRDKELPSNVIVAEMMIFANKIFAEFLAKNNIPTIYRGQMPPPEPLKPMLEFDPILYYSQRKYMRRAEFDTKPVYHYSLGLNYYTTATSPIRRYLDIVSQRQLLKLLEPDWKNYHTETELREIIAIIENSLDKANKVTSNRIKYWLLKYLSQQQSKIHQATVIDINPNRVRVIIEKYLLEFDIPNSGLKNISIGDKILVKLEVIDPRNQKIKAIIL